MLQANGNPLKVRFVSRTLPPIETGDGRYIVEPAVFGEEGRVRHCIVAHRERVNQQGDFDVVELSRDFGSYVKLLFGYSYGFEVEPAKASDRARASSILRRLIDLRMAEIVG